MNQNKNEIIIELTKNNYEDLTYHITPVLEITNAEINQHKKKSVPIILIGERHDFEKEHIEIFDNTVSLLEIIEKYVLYNINKDADTRIVMHFEASTIKSIVIDDYFDKKQKIIDKNSIHKEIKSFIDIWEASPKLNDNIILWQNIDAKCKVLYNYLAELNHNITDNEFIIYVKYKIDDILLLTFEYMDDENLSAEALGEIDGFNSHLLKIHKELDNYINNLKDPNNINDILNRLNSFIEIWKSSKITDDETPWKDIYDKSKSLYGDLIESRDHHNINNEFILNAKYKIDDILLLILKYMEDENLSDEAVGKINDFNLRLRNILKELDNYIKNSNNIEQKSDKNTYEMVYGESGIRNGRLSIMGQLNLIYAGGWLKPAFKKKYANIYHDKKIFKFHLQTVSTITSIIDQVEIYNIDYRSIIIDNIKKKLDKLNYSDDYTHYSHVYDLIVEIDLLYYGTHTIENPISKLYKELYNMDSRFCKPDNDSDDIFKNTFINSVIETNQLDSYKTYETDETDRIGIYYWILDLYSLLQLIYFTKLNTPPSIFIAVLGDTHRLFHNIFLNKWYNTNTSDDKYINYRFRFNDYISYNDNISLSSNHYIYKNLLFKNKQEININLKSTLKYKSNKYIEYKTYKESLNSYNFFTKYHKPHYRSDIQRNDNFKLDIVNNFSNICGVTSFNDYDDEKKEALFKYFESISYLFHDDNFTISSKQKTGGTHSNNQNYVLYQIQNNFAQYYMWMCGYDDPIRLMNAIKIYLYTQYMMQKQNKLEHIITHNTNKSTVNISEKLKNKSYIQKLPISYDKHLSKFEAPIVEVSAAAGGGSFAHAFRVLLISALIIVLILLLCKIMKSNHPYMLEDSQYSADLQTSIPINWYY